MIWFAADAARKPILSHPPNLNALSAKKPYHRAPKLELRSFGLA